MPTRIFMTALMAVLAGLVTSIFFSCQRGSQKWRPAAGPLFTRWAKEVSPKRVWSEYPRPQMVRKDWLNLNGLWDLAIVPREAPRPQDFARSILVPFPVESALSGIGTRVSPEERLWYRRSFHLPKSWRDKRVLLHFGAVDWEAEVFVNGTKVGGHRGGYDGFSFDITEALRPQGSQELVVAAWDPTTAGGQPVGKQTLTPGGIWYTPSSGIWQTVWLEPVPTTYIVDVHLTPEPDRGYLRIRTTAGGVRTEGLAVEAVAFARGREVGRQTAPAEEELHLAVSSPRLWSPEDPFLYDLALTLRRQGHTVDKVKSYFGLRKVEAHPDSCGVTRILLNGKPLFQLGPLDQGFWPDGLYTAPSDQALRSDVEMMKRLGFNMVRKHVKVEPDRWYTWCDRLGLLVWQDMPNGANRSPEERAQFERELAAMIGSRYNHPCVVMWVPFNEGWGQYETERIAQTVKSLDPTRLVDNASGWTDAGVGDVRDIHSYPDPVAPPLEPRRAAVLGEFGGLGYVVADHTWAEHGWGYDLLPDPKRLLCRYEGLLTKVHRLAQEAGLSAAVYTQLSDVESENNGLLTYDRQMAKMPPEAVRLANLGYLPPLLLSSATIFVEHLDASLTVLKPGAEIRYTVDGREPGKSDSLYTHPIRITESLILKVKAFWPEGRESRAATFPVTKVVPKPAAQSLSVRPGLKVSYYEGEWDFLPDFAGLPPVEKGVSDNIDLSFARRQELFALSFSGWIQVPGTGVYLFSILSDDGSRLLIGDEVVVDNDGLHGAREKQGAIALAAGLHPLRVLYFQRRGERALEVRYSGPDLEKQQIPPEVLFHEGS